MARTIGSLPIGAKVKDPGSKYYGKDIIFLKIAENHPGYPKNSATLLSEQIICLKAMDAEEPNNSKIDRRGFGNNRYIHSNLRQWLNSSASNWYSAQHSADEPPTKANVWSALNPYDEEKGFMANLTPELRSAILPTSLKVTKNLVDGGGLESFTDKIFLLSYTEIGLDNETSHNEGTTFDYFKSDSDRVATTTKECVENSDYTSSGLKPDDTWYWWTRTPHSSSTNPESVRCVDSGGSRVYDDAYKGSNGVRPALNLDSGILVSDKPDSDGVYSLLWMDPPIAPALLGPGGSTASGAPTISHAGIDTTLTLHYKLQYLHEQPVRGSTLFLAIENIDEGTTRSTTRGDHIFQPQPGEIFEDTWLVTGFAKPGSTYRWRARSKDVNGLESPWSDWLYFKLSVPVADGPYVISHIQDRRVPVGDVEIVMQPLKAPTKGSTVQHYELQVTPFGYNSDTGQYDLAENSSTSNSKDHPEDWSYSDDNGKSWANIPSEGIEPQFPLRVVLRELPNGTRDEIQDDRLIKRVGQIALDGSEDWTYIGDVEGGLKRFSAHIVPYRSSGYAQEGDILCDKIQPQANLSHWADPTPRGISICSEDNDIFYLTLKAEETPEEVLKDPATVLYELIEPQSIPLEEASANTIIKCKVAMEAVNKRYKITTYTKDATNEFRGTATNFYLKTGDTLQLSLENPIPEEERFQEVLFNNVSNVAKDAYGKVAAFDREASSGPVRRASGNLSGKVKGNTVVNPHIIYRGYGKTIPAILRDQEEITQPEYNGLSAKDESTTTFSFLPSAKQEMLGINLHFNVRAMVEALSGPMPHSGASQRIRWLEGNISDATLTIHGTGEANDKDELQLHTLDIGGDRLLKVLYSEMGAEHKVSIGARKGLFVDSESTNLVLCTPGAVNMWDESFDAGTIEEGSSQEELKATPGIDSRTTRWIRCKAESKYRVTGQDINLWQVRLQDGSVQWLTNSAVAITPKEATHIRCAYTSKGASGVQIFAEQRIDLSFVELQVEYREGLPSVLKVEVTNNGFDESPTWEDAYESISKGVPYVFNNTTKTAEKWGLNTRITIKARDTIGPIEIQSLGLLYR